MNPKASLNILSTSNSPYSITLLASLILALFRDIAHILGVQTSCPWLNSSPFRCLLLLASIRSSNYWVYFFSIVRGRCAAPFEDELSTHLPTSLSGRPCNVYI